MTRYLIESNDLSATLTEESDRVTSASANIDWAIGLDFAHVRDYCQRKGWYVIPVVPEQELVRPTQVSIGHTLYELKWVGDVLVRVSVHDGMDLKDLSYDDLPEALKYLL